MEKLKFFRFIQKGFAQAIKQIFFWRTCRWQRQSFKNRRQKVRRRKPQTGCFWNRYDFAYAGRNFVNQIGKIALDLTKNTSAQINNIARQRIEQTIRQSRQELERVFSKILRDTIEDVHQNPFWLYGKFKKEQFRKTNGKTLR